MRSIMHRITILGIVVFLINAVAYAQTARPKQAIPVNKPHVSTESVFDPCLVGEWVATNVVSIDGTWTGVGGFVVNFTSAGTQTIDYARMQPLSHERGTEIFKGKVTVRFYVEAGQKMYDYGKDSWILQLTGPYEAWGPTGVGGFEFGYVEKKYKCTETTLEYPSPNHIYVTAFPAYRVTLKRPARN